ncbi:M24 family metallopeptidase [Pseudomonas syringae]|uniref:Xaa-Pro aminopeptidase n=1 Tax=Pseudomonas syringae TaxID=317 RepID=A0A9Q3X6L5_PSESX|nr:M24 family metallopeptidase [Pseudomonas syringae]MCF5064049.1 M24 family metallopeptidase [Pseudomonas syringae]MCF5073484.1 M24 family metallopeptidase [Pseudomonas syringae]MCF5120461.1 M24 family metallopeptidase [Pseudomonas syringae]MCF5380525.1 M24 family metallopeptidase [Pseudomonas syringae]
MFAPTVYTQRRHALRERLSNGIVLLIGHGEAPINFALNNYPFRQDASFSYFFGINRPGLIGIIDLDDHLDTLYVEDSPESDVIWLGEPLDSAELANACGCQQVRSMSRVQSAVNRARRYGRNVHFLPPCRGETALTLSQLTQLAPNSLAGKASRALIREVVALREIKEAVELAEIESALRVTEHMHRLAMRTTRPGMVEREVVAHMRHVLGREGLQEAYCPIFTRRGDILHLFEHDNRLVQGDLVINDAAACSALGYASDVTRTLPVGGRFLPHQRELYEVLLEAQQDAIQHSRAGVTFMEVHLQAALKLAEGMRALGFFSGSPADIVASGAYALAFPHGLGHLLGLDVHDMDALGENNVGYDTETSRSEQFGLCHLRLGKALKPGMVLTVEPGIYFIPNLIARWQAENRHAGLINYSRFNDYEDFGGMRIEDVVVVQDRVGRVLGPAIPKQPDAIEAAMA